MVPVPLRRDDDDSEPLKPGIPAPEGSPSASSEDIDNLVARLAEQGIHSSELVIDLVLHDLAEEARSAVSGSGAAIALDRHGELVCRAAAGSTAPDLGIRLNTRSGLSALCIREGLPQLCRDTENDDRVDAAACRELGVRCIGVVPVFSGDTIIGIFQVFSREPDAFSTAHLSKLQELAGLVADSVRKSQQEVRVEPVLPSENPTPQEPLSIAAIMKKAAPHDPGMKFLRGIVIGLAILVAVLLGYDIGWHKARANKPLPLTLDTVPIAEEQPAQSIPQSTKSNGQGVGSPTQTAKPAKRASSDLPTQGGLIISQNGKVIYRQGPTTSNIATKAVEEPRSNAVIDGNDGLNPASPSLQGGITEGKLIHRVQPKYPPQAVEQHVQGPVVLHGTVGTDGILHDLAVVRGDPALSPAALEAVQQWRYEPYKRDGAPIAMPIDITIDFNLPR